MRFLGREISASSGGGVLKPGTPVETPHGPGVVDHLELGFIEINGVLELDVPYVYVLVRGESAPRKVCLCKLGLQDPNATEALHREFHRLWPPLPDPEMLPGPLVTALRAVTGRRARTVRAAAASLRLHRNAAALLRSATTAAVLASPKQRLSLEATEAAVLQALRENTHA